MAQVSSLICSDRRFEGLRLPQTPPILNTDVYYLVSLYTGTHAKTHAQTQKQISTLNLDRRRRGCGFTIVVGTAFRGTPQQVKKVNSGTGTRASEIMGLSS